MPRFRHVLGRLARSLTRLGSERGGNVAMISALAAPVLLGSFGLGTEVASWYANQHSMQNAADSAAIAAATNSSSDYATEAKAVAARYGYVDGQNGVAVTASDTVACPGGGNACYSVTISKSFPLILAQFVGYSGDTQLAGAPAKQILAKAVAQQSTIQRPYCLVALGQIGASITANGAPQADFSGCNVLANGDADCHGFDLRADVGDSHGTNSGCGLEQNSNVPLLADPYASQASNIPPNPCNGVYPQRPLHPADPELPASNLISGNASWGSVVPVCGDLKLTGPLTISNMSGPTTLVLYNGDLDLNGYTLQTTAGTGLTIIFAGDDNYTHIPAGDGTLDFAAPTSGPWSGVAIYQDPALTQGVDLAAAGADPTWNITGLVYMPHATVTFSGIVNKASNGLSCFSLVVSDLRLNGTSAILSHGQCTQAGLILPTNTVPGRAKLVS